MADDPLTAGPEQAMSGRPSVTFELDGNSSFVLTEALGEFARHMRQRADGASAQWAAEMARIADAMREQAEAAFSGRTEG